MIPYGRQSIAAADIAAVSDVLRSDFLTQGPVIPRFEAAVAQRCSAGHAVAVSSATAALHLACLALDIGPGDRVWTVPITFVASANCARYCGAEVDFREVERAAATLSVEALAAKLSAAQRANQVPKALVVVHLAGEPCDMAAIAALAQRYGVAVIEDASHALGAVHDTAPVGACGFSDITVFSFHPVKILTTGEGGMALTQRADLAERMRRLRGHGIERAPERMSRNDGPWYYEQAELGFNYRMTDLQAALGLSQLQRLDGFLAKRRDLAGRYDVLLSDLPVQPLARDRFGRSALHLYVVRIDQERADHRRVFEALRAAGIGVQLHYIPVHLQPYYQHLGFAPGDYPCAEAYYAEAISLPLYPDLSLSDQDRVTAALRAALAA